MSETTPRRRKRVVDATTPTTSHHDAGRIEYVSLSEIARWPRNPKKHDLREIEASLKRYGFVDPMIYDETTQRLVAGHGRAECCESMRDRELPPPKRVQVRDDGEWMVPVLRGIAFASEYEAEAYVVTNNRIGELGGWDPSLLADILEDHREDLSGIGYDENEIDKLRKMLDDGDAGGGEGSSERQNALADLAAGKGGKRSRTIRDPDEQAEAAEAYYDSINAMPRAKTGDVWRLGDHILVCGDSGREETLDRAFAHRDGDKVDCVITDPPYAIFGSSTGITSSIADDRMVVPFFEMVVRFASLRTKLFGHMLFFCDWRSWPALAEAHRRATLPIKNMIVWDKGGGLGSMYAQCHELIMFSVVDPPITSVRSRKVTGNRMVLSKNIMKVNRATGEDRPHNASKPIALVRTLLDNHTDEGETVLDMFGGGGTTLIACEISHRKCIAIDVEPKWIDVMIARWEKLTDRKAELVAEHGLDK